MGIVDLTPQRGAQVRVLGIEEAIDTLIVAQTLIGLSARLAAAARHKSPQRDKLVKSLERHLLAFDAEATGRRLWYSSGQFLWFDHGDGVQSGA